VLQKASPVLDPLFGEPALPDLSQVSTFLPQAKGESALDQLHGLLDGHVDADCDQQMHMVGHDHKVMESEFASRHIRTQRVDHQRGVAFRLQ